MFLLLFENLFTLSCIYIASLTTIGSNVVFILLHQNHTDTDCGFADIQCRFKGCNESYQRRHKKEHEESCYHKENVCKHCDQVIKVLLAEVNY